MGHRLMVRGLAVSSAAALVAVAFLDGGSPPTAGTPPLERSPRGGSVVFAAEEWPRCLNPITSCAAGPWAHWSVLQHVLPRAMELDPEGRYVASPLLTEAPTFANGGVRPGPPFTLTFHLNPEATWADGSPITSEDFAFTWKAMVHTAGTIRAAGYRDIESIETFDPETVVITFKRVFVDWPDLFGGAFGGILEKAAFPDADPQRPDLSAEMLGRIPFSGGPWILEWWSLELAVLARNDDYFGQVSNFDRVTFVPHLEPHAGMNVLFTGKVAATYLLPDDLNQVAWFSQVESPNVKYVGGDGALFNALWFNHASPPLDDARVREALMYAVDRQAIIDALVKAADPNAMVLNCGFLSSPVLGPWCDTRPFEGFVHDPERARSILRSAGYDCSKRKVACTRDGEPLVIEYSAISPSDGDTITQQLLEGGALEAGFKLEFENHQAGTMFKDILPSGRFQIAEFPQGLGTGPTITSLFACDSIPAESNGFSGRNWVRWCDRRATELMRRSDQALDPATRLALFREIYALQAQDFVSLPLYLAPTVSIWRTDKIDGPIDEYRSSLHGLFFNMNEWFVSSS